MSLVFYILGSMFLLGVLAKFSPTGFRALRQFWKAGEAQIGEIGRQVASLDPMTRLRQAIEDAGQQCNKAMHNAEEAKALVLRLGRKLEEEKARQTQLNSRITKALANPEKRDAAKSYALELARVEESISRYSEQSDTASRNYDKYCARVRDFQQQVREAQEEAASLKIELASSETNKEFAKQSAAFEPGNLSSELATQREAVRARIDQNNAAAGVSEDMGLSNYEQDDVNEERDARADAILQRFLPQPEPAKNLG